MNIPVNIPKTREAPFLRENWKKILGSTDNQGLKYVRVLNGIATITNGYVLVRCPLDVPDGFYNIDSHNHFVETTPTTSYFSNPYPDVESLRPDLRNIKFLGRLSNQDVRYLVSYADRAHVQDDTIYMDKEGFSFVSRSEVPTFKFPLKGVDELMVRPYQLKLALIEMLRYEHIHIYKEDGSTRTPLVFGHDWDGCALVKTITP